MPCRRRIRLHSAISPTPLALRSKGHVGLNLNPVCACTKHRSRAQIYRKGRPAYRNRLVQCAVNLRPRNPPAIGVNEHIPIGGRSDTVEIHPVGVDGLHIPSLTSGHHKVVRQIGVESREISECRAQGGSGRSVIVLIIEHHLRSFRRPRNRNYVRCTSATGLLRKLRYARQVRTPPNVIGKKPRADR